VQRANTGVTMATMEPQSSFDRQSRQLLAAALAGRRDRVALLLDTGRARASCADPEGTSPLMLAAAAGDAAIARDLLRRGAPVNQRRRSGATALFYACQAGRADLAELLLSNGADPSLPVSGRLGGSPLMAAAQNGHADCLRLLLSAGAPVDWRGAGADGATALQLACWHDRRQCAQLLLAAGARPLLARRDGATPLSAAAQQGSADLCRALLSAAPEFSSAASPADLAAVGAALLRACRAGHTEAVRAILNCGGRPFPAGHFGASLHAAALFGHSDTAEVLLAAGASPVAQDSSGRLPADCALAGGHSELHQRLLGLETKASLLQQREQLDGPRRPSELSASMAGGEVEFACNDLPGEQGFTDFGDDCDLW
ncbi:hypothetical protein BOX15_Mlig003793g1, partial [Macrostomum lignano]